MFKHQVKRNVETYMDDIIVKSKMIISSYTKVEHVP